MFPVLESGKKKFIESKLLNEIWIMNKSLSEKYYHNGMAVGNVKKINYDMVKHRKVSYGGTLWRRMSQNRMNKRMAIIDRRENTSLELH